MLHRPSVILSMAAVVAATLVPPLPATAAEPTTVELTGTLMQLADEPGGDAGLALLDVAGSGYLSVDVSGVALPAAAATVTLEVPAAADVAADDTDAEVFDELAAASSTEAPVEVVDVAAARATKAAVVRTPNTPATHRVYAALVSPGGTARAPEQTAAAVQNAVAFADDYWNQQSSGSVRFTLAGTVGWYSSPLSCKTQSEALWNEAAALLRQQVGFTDAPNDHIVLFFPGNADCGSVGLGSVGNTVNDGGVSWQLGTDAAISKGTLAHELGHNISLGHASWAECSSATPSPGVSGTTGCPIRFYGDGLDVQGYANSGVTGGALSAPAAVRASIWPAAAAVQAPQGTSTHTLNAVSSNTGLRSVIVDDTDGVSYFVEYRNYTDEDAQLARFRNYCAGGAGGQCFSPAGVRVLRLEGAGGPGTDSYLLGRTVDGVDRTSFAVGETFRSQGTAGVSVTVTAITGTTATVSVQRGEVVTPPASVTAGTVTVARAGADGTPRVGDTLSLSLGSTWTATAYAYQWLRDGAAIAGATSSTYVLQTADRGARVNVRVTGSAPGLVAASNTDTSIGQGIGPVADPLPVATDGTVSIVSAATLVATPAGWPAGTTYAYQWYRGVSATTATQAIAGATSAAYAPTAADSGRFVRVALTATAPGRPAVTVSSAAADYSLRAASGTVRLQGRASVGQILSVANAIQYRTVDGPVVPTRFTYQWLRNGRPIAGATGATYAVTRGDWFTQLSVQVTAIVPARAPLTSTTGSAFVLF